MKASESSVNGYSPLSYIAGRYEIVGHPLTGGMGVVYVCFDHHARRPVALKAFKPEYLPDRTARDNFLQEGNLWLKLGGHPHIVQAYGVEHVGDGREVYIVLELIAQAEGNRDASLRSWLRPEKPLSLEIALLFALQIAKGMKHASSILPGFVHRDLKPENVLVGADRIGMTDIQRVRVTDFGLATLLQRIGQPGSNTLPPFSGEALTHTQFVYGVAGTPIYMAPEQWTGNLFGPQTDIYALGCILIEMLTGERAAPGKTLAELEHVHRHGQLRNLPVDLFGGIGRLVQRCVALEPAERYSTWIEVEEALADSYTTLSGRSLPDIDLHLDQNRAEQSALGWSYNAIGLAYANISKFEMALSYFEQVTKTGREIGDRMLEGAGLGNLGVVYKNLGDFNHATEFALLRLTIARETGDRQAEAQTLGNLGNICKNLGKTGQAIEFLEQALEVAQAIGDLQGVGATLANLGNVYLELRELSQAINCHEQALDIMRTINNQSGEATILGNLGLAYDELGETGQAIIYYEQALKMAHELGDQQGEGRFLGNLARAQEMEGNVDLAIRLYEQAISIKQTVGDVLGAAVTRYNFALLLVALKQWDAAFHHLELAEPVFAQVEHREYLIKIRLLIRELCVARRKDRRS